MRQLVFPLQFKGKQVRWPGRYRARTTASGLAWRVALGEGLEVALEPGPGSAAMDATIETVVGHGVPDDGLGTFTMTGTVSYGGMGALTFQSEGSSVLGPSAISGLQEGAVILRVTGGAGRLAGTTGLITSTFSVTAGGERVDNHLVQVVLPD
jgi:hypothetical protein